MYKSKKNISICIFILLAAVLILLYIRFTDSSLNIAETSSDNSNVTLYADVNEDDWFFNDVKYVSENNLMNGTASGIFSPYEETTRGMIVTILWRLDGESSETGISFSDVGDDAYYHDAVVWASNHKIVNGYNETTFGADDAATREQMISIIYRYAEYKNYDVSQNVSLDMYKDADSVSDYALDAIKWGCSNKIISGTSDDQLSPGDLVQRCQVAAILHRFCEQYDDIETLETLQQTDAPVQGIYPSKEDDDDKQSNISGSGGSLGGSSGGESSQPDKTTQTPEPIPTADQTGGESGNNTQTSSGPTLIVNSVETKAGENIQLNVDISNNPGILGMTLIAYYDETYCTLESVESGDAFKDILDLTTSKTLNSGVRFMWDGIDLTDEQIKDGTALIMNFHISDNAPEGKIPITIKCYEGDAVDKNLETIPLQILNGSITVKSK